MNFSLVILKSKILYLQYLQVLFCVLWILNSQVVFAQDLYAYRTGKRGTVTFTSKKPEGKNFWKVDPAKKSFSTYSSWSFTAPGWSGRPVASHYDDLIINTSKEFQLEPALVKAVVHVESAFNPRAKSNKGATGLMQLMPGTADRFGVKNINQPTENILGGVKYLRWLFTYFNGNVPLVLAGYNAGEGAVDKYGGIPPYRETQDYVQRVLKMRDAYRCNYVGKGRGKDRSCSA
jgi:soluble lytic murein transglycosylase-like protein